MKTRSVKSSQVPGLSLRVAGSEGLSPSSPNLTCLGPIAPRLRYTDAAPGPPFKAKVTGTILAFDGVGGEDHFAALLAFVVDRQGADGHLISQGLAAELDALGGVRIRREGRFLLGGLVLIFIFSLLGGGRGRSLGILGRCKGERQEEDGDGSEKTHWATIPH